MTNCSIVRDLFTAYVSGAGSEDTRALVDEHIDTCEECRVKLAEVQERVAVQLRENDAANINVFKKMKKRIFQRNVLVAVIASVAAVIIAIGGFWFIYHNDKPIEYADGNIRVERNIAEMYLEIDGITTTATVLDVVSDRNYYGSYNTSRVLNVNGEDTEVVYFYFTETISTKWQKKAGVFLFRLTGVGENMSFGTDIVNYPSLPMELYYLEKPLGKVNAMNDEDYYAQRTDGVMLWSGIIE